MADDLDLTKGDEKAAEKIAARQGGKSTRSSSSGGKSATAAAKAESELSTRLARTFDRIVKALESRGDMELADAIREDADAMGAGLLSLTRNLKPLRSPLVFILNLVEPVLAFGRVARILFLRFLDRRDRLAAQAREQVVADGQMEPAPTPEGAMTPEEWARQ
jgi:hypothetical protein